MDWPYRSPDLSPIEQVWEILGRKIRERQNVNNLKKSGSGVIQRVGKYPNRTN